MRKYVKVKCVNGHLILENYLFSTRTEQYHSAISATQSEEERARPLLSSDDRLKLVFIQERQE